MKIKKSFIFCLLFFAINSNTYSNKNMTAIHPIAQQCNKNALKIEKIMRHYNIAPLKFKQENLPTEITIVIEEHLIIMSSAVILEKFNAGMPYPLVRII